MADSWVVVVIAANRLNRNVEHAEAEGRAVLDMVREYGLCIDPIDCVGGAKGAIREALRLAARRLRDGSYWEDGVKRSKLLVFVAGKGHAVVTGDVCRTLFEPADAPDNDEPSPWLCVEDEVRCAVETAELRDVKVVTFMAMCRSYCHELPEDLPDPSSFTLSGENAYYDIWVCGEDTEVDDYQYLGCALRYYLSLGVSELSNLLLGVKEDLEQLTFGRVDLHWAQPTQPSRVLLGPPRSYVEPGPIMADETFRRVRRSIFLARHLERMASHELEASFEDARRCLAEVGRLVAQREADTQQQLHTRHELLCIRQTRSLQDVATWLQLQLPNLPAPEGSPLDVKGRPPSFLEPMAGCMLDFVDRNSDEELAGFAQAFVDDLCTYAESFNLGDLCDLETVPSSETERLFYYPFVIPGDVGGSAEVKAALERRICDAMAQLGLSAEQVVFARGSLWIILLASKPVARRNLFDLLDVLKAWTKEAKSQHPAWRGAGCPRLATVTDIPGGLRQLVRQVSPLSRAVPLGDPPVTWLKADDVRERVAEVLRGTRPGLKASQVWICEGDRVRRMGEWLHGTGRLSAIVADDRRRLEFQAGGSTLHGAKSLVDTLETLSGRRFACGCFEDTPEFQAGVFLMHSLYDGRLSAESAVGRGRRRAKASSPSSRGALPDSLGSTAAFSDRSPSSEGSPSSSSGNERLFPPAEAAATVEIAGSRSEEDRGRLLEMWLSRLSNSEHRTPRQFLREVCADAAADYLASGLPLPAAQATPETSTLKTSAGYPQEPNPLTTLPPQTALGDADVAGSIPPVLVEQLRHFPETELRLRALLRAPRVVAPAAVESVKWPIFIEVMEGLTTRVATRGAAAESVDSEIDGEISAALQQFEENLQTKGADEALSIFIEEWQ